MNRLDRGLNGRRVAHVEKEWGKRWSEFVFQLFCISLLPDVAEHTPALRDRQFGGRMADAA
jgi:hypothetical protein